MLHELLRMVRQIVETADAEQQLSRRPRIRQTNDSDRLTAPMAGRGLGNHRNADAVLDHPADRIETAEAPRMRALADASAMLALSAPCVMLAVSATCTNRRKSVRSKRTSATPTTSPKTASLLPQ
jgi:hypothetical protein